jgi:hypothetical protein
MSEAWPSPDAQSGPLPRIDDLPIADQGYEQEAVRAAFDAFYRHAAQLDATLRALEAVEVFRRDADALRNDLRAIRELGGLEAEPAWTTQTYEAPRAELPAVVLRLAAEAALIIAVAVIAGIANLSSLAIVLLMAAAFAIVATSEWLAARARYVAPVGGFVLHEGEPAPYVEAPAPQPQPQSQWGAAEEPDEETEPEALTVIGAPAVEVDPWEQDGAVEAEDAPDAAEPAADAVGPGFFRRRRR